MVLLVGLLVILSILSKCLLRRMGAHASVAYIVLGLMLRLADTQWNFLGEYGVRLFGFLASVGVFTLLFRIGLESDLASLLGQLRRARYVWLGDVSLSGGLGFAAAYLLLGLPLVTSLFVAVALTATSVGVSVSIWDSAGALGSSNGKLLVDIAEMDDISGVILMGLLFAVAPVLGRGEGLGVLPLLGRTAAVYLGLIAGFGLACFLFSRYAEGHLTGLFRRIEQPPEPMVSVAATGMIIAAVAGLLGFSIAIGAFFAGLAYSRDPRAVKMEASFSTLYEFFMPFFFIGIGLRIEPSALGTAVGLGGVLVVVAMAGKIIGSGFPTLVLSGWTRALLVGLSLIPRAEISLIIMQHGLDLGRDAVPPRVYAAMVLVSAATCIAAPLALQPLLKRWPQKEEQPAHA